jgi:hypothetical protein
MKKIININFHGRVVPIEESAFDILNQYVESLRKYFANELTAALALLLLHLKINKTPRANNRKKHTLLIQHLLEGAGYIGMLTIKY